MAVYVAMRPVPYEDGQVGFDEYELIGVFPTAEDAHKKGSSLLSDHPLVFECELGQAYDWQHLLEIAQQLT